MTKQDKKGKRQITILRCQRIFIKRQKLKRVGWMLLDCKLTKSLSVRSNRPEVFCKKDVLKNFIKFTGKHLCQSLFFNEVAGLRPATSLKKRLWHRCFPFNFAKFLRTSFFIEHLWWLLLISDTFEFFLVLAQ